MPIEGAIHLRYHSIPLMRCNNKLYLSTFLSTVSSALTALVAVTGTHIVKPLMKNPNEKVYLLITKVSGKNYFRFNEGRIVHHHISQTILKLHFVIGHAIIITIALVRDESNANETNVSSMVAWLRGN